jgi:hypothetical protein
MTKDRKKDLIKSVYNGIDFVEVANQAQTQLRVHFFNSVPLLGHLKNTPTITGGETIRTVEVNPVDNNKDWSLDGSHLVLTLNVEAPGDFSTYTLAMSADILDSQYSQVLFSFKAGCPSDLDCQSPAAQCPPLDSTAPPIDYLSKDFLGFRQALLSFSALRYPEWQERSEADFGVMFLEALSSLADDLSYQQDRIQAEAGIETATQRRSVVSLARLVDYEPSPATSATVVLQFDVASNVSALPDGVAVAAIMPDGSTIPFETGASLRNRAVDLNTQKLLELPESQVSQAWNRGITPYWFDDSQKCLKAGATQMYVCGHGFEFYAGQALLIDTAGLSPADPPIRQIVHLICPNPGANLYPAIEMYDYLYLTQDSPPAPTPVTQISWESTDKLKTDCDLTKTVLAGNLIAASQGLTVDEDFIIPAPPSSPPPPNARIAVVRTGPNDCPCQPSFQCLHTLARRPLAWLAQSDPTLAPLPEIVLIGTIQGGVSAPWQFITSLLNSSGSTLTFTLDPSLYSPVAMLADPPAPQSATVPLHVVQDYDGDAGDTIRFGDGTFGPVPEDGTVFKVYYRFGLGAAGNVAPDSITQILKAPSGVLRVTNPMAAQGGTDAETLEHVARMAPQQFRAVQYRAVVADDYAAAAKKLPWVEQAGTVFRWTGSWQTVFTTPDPLNSEEVAVDQQIQLINLLNRYRMAGCESYVPQPQYVSLDIQITVCALPSAFRGDVEAALLTALGSRPAGFFNHNNFVFGQPLLRSDLEITAQRAAGMAGVLEVCYRIRGQMPSLTCLPDTVSVGTDQIIRCDNDPNLPEHGSLKIIVKGGK